MLEDSYDSLINMENWLREIPPGHKLIQTQRGLKGSCFGQLSKNKDNKGYVSNLALLVMWDYKMRKWLGR